MIDTITNIDGAAVATNTIFLVSGQEMEIKVGDRRGHSASTSQRVVIAEDAVEALRLLAEKEPDFKSLGVASLEDYEATARRIRAVVTGSSSEWALHAN